MLPAWSILESLPGIATTTVPSGATASALAGREAGQDPSGSPDGENLEIEFSLPTKFERTTAPSGATARRKPARAAPPS